MQKKDVADLLFVVQITFIAVFGGSQFLQLLTSTEDVSATWFGAWQIFLLLNFWLAWNAHKAKPTRLSIQTLWTYGLWSVAIALDLGCLVLRSTWRWDQSDTITALIITLGVALTLLISSLNGKTFKDPLVKGWLAVFFKAVPQLMLAWSILLVGGAGLSPIAIAAGHITILSRLGQLHLSMDEANREENRKASFISEMPNWLSWVVVTLAWLWWFFV